jgi:hypothetical protein
MKLGLMSCKTLLDIHQDADFLNQVFGRKIDGIDFDLFSFLRLVPSQIHKLSRSDSSAYSEWSWNIILVRSLNRIWKFPLCMMKTRPYFPLWSKYFLM